LEWNTTKTKKLTKIPYSYCGKCCHSPLWKYTHNLTAKGTSRY